MADEPEHGGAVTSNGPLYRQQLDALRAQGNPTDDQTLVIGCPQCNGNALAVGYAHGFIALTCIPCKRALGLVAVAGDELRLLNAIAEDVKQLVAAHRAAQ